MRPGDRSKRCISFEGGGFALEQMRDFLALSRGATAGSPHFWGLFLRYRDDGLVPGY
jgi:hypothetical protein